MNWKKYILVFSSVTALVASEQIIHACADFDNYDTYPSFFGNKAPDKPAYTPFFYVGYDLYYDDYNEEDFQSGLSQTDIINKQYILKEWQEYTNNQCTLKDIEAVVYGADANSISQLGEGTLAGFEKNQFAQWLGKGKKKDVLQYLSYAKSCEINALTKVDNWDTTKAKSTTTNQQLMDEGLKLRKRTKDDFLKMKYNFQILRMAFYDEQYDGVLSLFEELTGNTADKSVAYTRCLGFKAGAYYKNKDKVQAGYYYSKMFQNSDAYKSDAMVSYEWCRTTYDPDKGEKIKDYTDAIYNLCKNDQERAVVTVMNALRTTDDALPLIEKAYRLDPNVAGIDVLVNREINKIEENYFDDIVYGENKLPNSSMWYYNIRNYDYEESRNNKDSVNTIYTSYLKQLNTFNRKMIAENKNASKAFWYLSSAYIAYMLQDKNSMNTDMAAAKASGMNRNEERLYNVVEILALLKNNTTITTQVETDLLPKLKSLNALAVKNYSANKTFRDVMQHLIAGKYLQQKDTIKAVYAMAHASTYDSARNSFNADQSFKDIQGNVLDAMSVAQLNKVQAFEASAKKSAFEKWLVAGTYYTADVLKDLEGTKYIRDYKFKEAEQIFAKSGAGGEFPNPFMPQINDYIEIYKQDTLRTFSKLTFSKRMAELQDIIAKNPNDAGALYGYAVALYNISYYGKASNMVDYTRDYTNETAYYISDAWRKMSRPFQEYYGVYTAEQYFNKAAAATSDPELKAKSIWGAAKCWEKRCPGTPESRYSADDMYFVNALKNPYFRKLNSGTASKYLKSVESTCDYYGAYLSRNK
ncbi:hypothetical protein DBR32_14445 [Taibaiella sp. KBW10]|uniref:hypothetical protein n=1 Tax=Taibaiella sp. KBW10 TaxID=2153357 RepID=UPI000F5AEC89|nr:hypothetical protein [Taibaiella sp. KBW10]RQO29781.1 hypothetical protein DBR32_14445 [Taibaiella sp. KBW10]